MVKKPLLFEQQGNSRDGISRLNGTALGEWNPSVVIPAESTLWPFVGFHPSLTWHGEVRVTIVTLVTSCDSCDWRFESSAVEAPARKRSRSPYRAEIVEANQLHKMHRAREQKLRREWRRRCRYRQQAWRCSVRISLFTFR